MAAANLDEDPARPYSLAHDRRRHHFDRSPPPRNSGTGGHLRL